MKNQKLPAFLNSPLGIVILVSTIVLVTEIGLMELLHHFLMEDHGVPDAVWGFLDAVVLTAILAPALYFLVFRRMRESEARFRQITTAAQDAIVVVDRQARITDWNLAAQRIFQYSAEEALGQPLHQLITPLRYREDAVRGFARFQETGVGTMIGKTIEITALRKDGSEFPAELSVSMVTWKGHRHAIGILRDISERKRAYLALLESEKRFSSLANAAGDMIFTINTGGEVGYVNDIAARALRATPEQIIGKHVHDLFPPEHFQRQWGNLQKVFETGESLYFEAPSRFPNGELWLGTWLVPLRDTGGIITAVLGASHDISARRAAETAFKTLVASLTQNIGAEFFHETVRSLSAWLGAECVIAGELLDDSNRVRALAMQLDGKAVEHYEYALPGTPCNSVASKGYCEYPEGVQKLFPTDKDLIDMGAEAYVGTPVRDKNGETVGILCAISRHKLALPARAREVMEMIAARSGIEIERKRAEEKIRTQLAEIQRARLEWQTVFDSINDPIFLHDSEFRVVRANAAYAGQAGKTFKEIIGQPYYAIFPKNDAPLPACLRGMEKAEEEEEEVAVGEASFRSRSFSVRDEQNAFLYAVHIFEDITEAKLAAQALRDERDFAQSLVKTAQVIILSLDTEGRIINFNPYLAKLSGWRLDEMRGKDWVSTFLPERNREATRKLLQSALSGKQTRGSVDALLTRDGRELQIEWYDSTLKDKQGKVTGLLAVGQDITSRKLMEQDKLEAGVRIRDALEHAIGAIAATLEQRDPYTAGHQRRVAELAAAIAREMGLASEVIEGIHFGGLIHDIGKISVPAEILGKPGQLSDIEFDLIKTHAEAGYQIVKGIAFPWPVAEMVHQHHERMDGSGYPQGLAGEQITLEARILAVADVVEAMSANRPYRPGLGMDAALAEITRVRGAQLDPAAVDACLRVIREQGFAFSG